MKKEAQYAMASPLRNAIWNWIGNCPTEYNDTLANHRRLEGAPERVFDLLYDLHESANKISVWPALTALLCISSDRIKAEYQFNSVGVPRVTNRRVGFSLALNPLCPLAHVRPDVGT